MPSPIDPSSSTTAVSLGDDILDPLPGETDPVASFRLASSSRTEFVDGRYELGAEIGLHGNWVGIDAAGRAMLAQALHTALGGGEAPMVFAQLADPEELARAERWGKAIRLGQRLSGGVAAPLQRSRLAVDRKTLWLVLEPRDAALYGEAVEKRHRALAEAMGREPVVET